MSRWHGTKSVYSLLRDCRQLQAIWLSWPPKSGLEALECQFMSRLFHVFLILWGPLTTGNMSSQGSLYEYKMASCTCMWIERCLFTHCTAREVCMTEFDISGTGTYTRCSIALQHPMEGGRATCDWSFNTGQTTTTGHSFTSMVSPLVKKGGETTLFVHFSCLIKTLEPAMNGILKTK